MREPGLIYRRVFPIDRGRVCVEEKWNIDAPGCPLIRSPWLPGPFNDGPIFIRQVEMTEAEFLSAKVELHAYGQSTPTKHSLDSNID